MGGSGVFGLRRVAADLVSWLWCFVVWLIDFGLRTLVWLMVFLVFGLIRCVGL